MNCVKILNIRKARSTYFYYQKKKRISYEYIVKLATEDIMTTTKIKRFPKNPSVMAKASISSLLILIRFDSRIYSMKRKKTLVRHFVETVFRMEFHQPFEYQSIDKVYCFFS